MNVAQWLARGRDLKCFLTDTEQAEYLLAWRRGDATTVKSKLRDVFSGPYPLHLVNSAVFGGVYASFEEFDDGPDMLPEDWREGDFVAQLFDGTTVSCKWLTGGGQSITDAAARSIMFTLARQVALATSTRDKADIVTGARDEIVAANTSTRCSMSALCRAVGAAMFFASAPAGSPAVAKLVPEHAGLAASASHLRTRADRLTYLWWSILQAGRVGESCPITHAALAACSTVTDVSRVLGSAEGPQNANLIRYLAAKDY